MWGLSPEGGVKQWGALREEVGAGGRKGDAEEVKDVPYEEEGVRGNMSILFKDGVLRIRSVLGCSRPSICAFG